MHNCDFEYGSAEITGSNSQRMDKSESAQQCAALVKKNVPRANGVTWNPNMNCYALFDMHYIITLGISKSECADCQTCIFEGRLV